MTQNSRHLVWQTLSGATGNLHFPLIRWSFQTLPLERFIHIHKSYIVAINKIDTLEGNMVQLGKERLPVGANYRGEVVRRVFG